MCNDANHFTWQERRCGVILILLFVLCKFPGFDEIMIVFTIFVYESEIFYMHIRSEDLSDTRFLYNI